MRTVECYECFAVVPFEESYPLMVTNNLRVCSLKCLARHAEITRTNTQLRLAGRADVQLRSEKWQLRRWPP